MTSKHVFNKGDLIEFETGEYSDHQIDYPVRVLKKFNLREAIDAFKSEHPDQDEDYSCSFSAAIAYLAAKGFIEEPDEQLVYRVWLGGYGTLQDTKDIGA